MSSRFALAVGCFLGAAGLTLLHHSKRAKKEAEFLTSATRLALKELGKLFDDDNRERDPPALVAVSGRVGSSEPIACKISGLKGVLVEEKEELEFERKHPVYGCWSRDSALTNLKTKEVPWYLDDGTGQLVYVRGAREACRFSFAVKREVFEECPKTPTEHKFLKLFGVKRTESLIPTGTSLTVVGEAVRDESGRVWVQPPPEEEAPFYVFQMTMDELVAYLKQNGSLFKDFSEVLMISVGFVVVFGWMC
ncbi:unnamed protein product [Linum tenue]|uniref:RING-type E3 ubiquitin transferase n=1 Tax=Linum tenue TaxID=586396 RepID=A0AAV0QQ35_9ROSI|nr:unnamed protein product [Linum tenue]